MNRLVEKSQNNVTRIKIGESAATGVHATTGGGNNNIILLRGAQSDSGHIILQNGQELLQLLNGEAKVGGGGGGLTTSGTTSGKTIILQSPRIKQQAATEANKNVKNRIMLHQAAALDHHQHHLQPDSGSNLSLSSGGQSMDGGETILLQTNGLSGKRISATTLSDGSILLHPRMMDSFATTTTTTAPTGASTASTAIGTTSGGNSSDGPILLQTLKRFDKSIFVLRNSGPGTATTTKTALVPNSSPPKMETSGGSLVTSAVAENESSGVVATTMTTTKTKTVSSAGGRGGNGGIAKANVFNKANNVIASGGGGSAGGARSNGISTRSSTGQQKQRGTSRTGDNKKDSPVVQQSNIPLGSGKFRIKGASSEEMKGPNITPSLRI